MTYLVVAAEALVVLLLLAALLVGQPASAQADRDRIAAQSTENASLRATLLAKPRATSCLYTGTTYKCSAP